MHSEEWLELALAPKFTLEANRLAPLMRQGPAASVARPAASDPGAEGPSALFQNQQPLAGDRQKTRVLLLQGPVGPFFRQLHTGLLARGVSVQHVSFNAADTILGRSADCTRFSGTDAEWEVWLHFELYQSRPDVIVLFGSNRPAHQTARRVAGLFEIPVLSLEEGYLRSGYITCETGGNNQASPMIDWAPHRGQNSVATQSPPPAKASFLAMSIWASIYYLLRDSFTGSAADALFHRPREGGLTLVTTWTAHILRRALARLCEARQIRTMQRNGGFLLVPLQVPTDSQIRVAARGWTTDRLIDASLAALSRSGLGQRLVFKLHPLDRGGADLKRHILQRAEQLGLSGRVQVLHSGRIGALAEKAIGMIVINSTSAFSALHYDVPVLVLGDAVFRHADIVTVGDNEIDVATFFKVRQAKQRDCVNTFLSDLKATSLMAGDFYAGRGIYTAVQGVIARIDAFALERRRKGSAQ